MEVVLRGSRLRLVGASLGLLAGYLAGLAALTLEDSFHGVASWDSLGDLHHHLAAGLVGAVLAVLGLYAAAWVERAEARAAQEHVLLQTLIDVVPVPIFYKDLGGRYLGCNQAFERFLGRERASFLGKTVHELGPREIADKYEEKDRELFARPGTQVYDWLVARGGERREVVFHKATFQDGRGQVAGLVGAVFDVTERNQVLAGLHRETSRQQALFGEASPLAVLTLAGSGEVLSLTPALAALLGVAEAAAVVGRPAAPLFTDAEALAPLLSPGGATSGEYRVLRLRGKGGAALRAGASVIREATKLHLVVTPLLADEFFIPICAACNRMRDGASGTGTWVSPALYLSKHQSEIKDPKRTFVFTHAVCEACVKAIYPEYADG